MADITYFFGGVPFDASTVDPSGSTGQLPISGPDGLPVVISASDVKPAKIDGNYFLELALTVIEGPDTNAEGTMRLNLINSNETAVRIAQRELSALCRVTGVWNLAESSELHGIPFRVVTAERKYTGNDGKEYSGSEIKKILDINGKPPMNDNGGAAPAPASSTAKPVFSKPAPPSAPAQTAKPGWKKNEAPASTTEAPAKPGWMKKPKDDAPF